jgi:hypothetical protein
MSYSMGAQLFVARLTFEAVTGRDVQDYERTI